jgi:hypothetical protein
LLFCAVKHNNMLKNRFLLYIFLIVITLTGCAKRGSITGGPQDTIPPVLVRSNPENMSTNFSGNQIRIDFNEYIKIKDVNKQLIISPPMNTQPDIMPMGNASRYITIKIKDTLQPNTTYSFNFGQSITDNNEGNPYSQFKFVFSTGAYIDSLTLNGTIKDAYTKETDDFVTVMLYEANEQFNDSTIYKERPRYVTNTLDSLTMYSLQNLKAGKYHIFALKDKSNNYKYDPKSDKIAFLKDPITIPTDTLYTLELFEEKRAFKAVKPTFITSNRLVLGYEGDPRGVKPVVKNGENILPSVTTQLSQKDSVQIWIPRGITADSLQVSVNHSGFSKDFYVKMKDLKASDSLAVSPVQKGILHFREKFAITASTPLVAFDKSKMALIRKDSTAVEFTTAYNEFEQKLEFDFAKQEDQQYTVTLLPGALKDFYGKENDSLQYKLSTQTLADYGNLRVSLENVNRFPLILEILNAKGDVQASHYSEKETQINFDAILPEKYTLRVIYDDNKNREWDSGNYLEKRQPEEVIYFPKEVDVRANWDVEQDFNLGG